MTSRPERRKRRDRERPLSERPDEVIIDVIEKRLKGAPSRVLEGLRKAAIPGHSATTVMKGDTLYKWVIDEAVDESAIVLASRGAGKMVRFKSALKRVMEWEDSRRPPVHVSTRCHGTPHGFFLCPGAVCSFCSAPEVKQEKSSKLTWGGGSSSGYLLDYGDLEERTLMAYALKGEFKRSFPAINEYFNRVIHGRDAPSRTR